MRQKWLALFIAMSVVLSFGVCCQPPPSHAEMRVYIVPETVVARPGESIELDVKVEPGENAVTGGEINISFDPSMAQVLDIKPGYLLGSSPFVGCKEMDNEAGKVRYALGRVGDPPPVPTPDGVFATIELEAVRSIQGQVCQLTRAAFCNEDFEDIGEIMPFEPAEKPAPTPTKVYHFTAYTHTPSDHRVNKAMKYTMEVIAERTGGQITFDFQEGALSDPEQTYDAVCRREVDIAMIVASSRLQYTPSSLLFWIPGLIPDAYVMQGGLDQGVADLIRSEWNAGEGEAISFFTLCCYDIATNSRPVILPDDLNELMVRSVNKASHFYLSLCGAAGCYISTADAYEALTKGTIDSQLFATSDFLNYRWNEVTKYYTWIHLMYSLGAIFMNKEALGTLPPDLNKTFLDAWQNDYPAHYLNLMDEDHAEIKRIAQRDCEFHETTPEERRIWRHQLTEPMLEWLFQEMKADPEIVRTAVALYLKYQKH